VLLFDGLFLLRPELCAFWDASVYVHIGPAVAVNRARVPDPELFGWVDVVEERYRTGTCRASGCINGTQTPNGAGRHRVEHERIPLRRSSFSGRSGDVGRRGDVEHCALAGCQLLDAARWAWWR
jgi:hypothetical protein